MKSRTAALTLLFASALFATADEAQRKSSAEFDTPMKWNTDPAYWDKLIVDDSKSSALRIGKSDFTISGPLIEGFRRSRPAPEQTLGRKILGLPIVRLFVPQPMPNPPGGGKYFRWGESNRPWISVAEARGGAGADNAINHEPQAALISISR